MKVSVDQGLWWKVGCDLVVGVRVGSDDGGAGFVQGLKVINHPAKGFVRLIGFQVTDVLADEGLRADRERDVVLQVGADGEDRIASGRAELDRSEEHTSEL